LKRKTAVSTAKPFAELVFVEKGESGEKRRTRFYRSDCVCPSRAVSTLSTRSIATGSLQDGQLETGGQRGRFYLIKSNRKKDITA